MPLQTIQLQPSTGDLESACIFTGVPVKKKDGEHVIPNWLRKQYGLHHQPVEMGQTERFAKVLTFRAPADPDANRDFGKIEDKVQRQSASLDELHLWSKKISVGMIWNHWRLAKNDRHPHAPVPFDERHLHLVLQDFQREFALWQRGTYGRSGSTIQLPSAIDAPWLAHAFGATVDQSFSTTHDRLLPFGYFAFNRKNTLIVSSFLDDGELEASFAADKWAAAGLAQETNQVRLRAALASVFAEQAASGIARLHPLQPSKFDELHKVMAYQLGVILSDDGETFRPRVAGDL